MIINNNLQYYKQMKKTYLFILLATLLLSTHSVKSQQLPCTADSIQSWLGFLASDAMKGRANGTEEIETVAEWLSMMYKQYGLQDISGLTNYIQPYLLDNNDSFIHKNIIGSIQAKEEYADTDFYVLLSAHFDHIGMNRYPVDGDSIYNGADDNAAGVVAMLAIAKNLFDHKVLPESPIVFAAFSNEETGLRGSKYFCESGVLPIGKVKININFDMVSHTDEYGKNKFYITGPGYSNFQDIVIEFNKDKAWEIVDVGTYANMLYRLSDNYSFVLHANQSNDCVPAHTIATSVALNSHIHKLYDEVEYVDFENMNHLVDYLTQLVLYIARKDVEVKCN